LGGGGGRRSEKSNFCTIWKKLVTVNVLNENIDNVRSNYAHNIYRDESTHTDCENEKSKHQLRRDNIKKNKPFNTNTFNSTDRRSHDSLYVSRNSKPRVNSAIFPPFCGTVAIFWDFSVLENATVE